MRIQSSETKIIFLDVDGVLNNEKNTIFMYKFLGKDKYFSFFENNLI